VIDRWHELGTRDPPERDRIFHCCLTNDS
jgi:hypothetical protein